MYNNLSGLVPNLYKSSYESFRRFLFLRIKIRIHATAHLQLSSLVYLQCFMSVKLQSMTVPDIIKSITNSIICGAIDENNLRNMHRAIKVLHELKT